MQHCGMKSGTCLQVDAIMHRYNSYTHIAFVCRLIRVCYKPHAEPFAHRTVMIQGLLIRVQENPDVLGHHSANKHG